MQFSLELKYLPSKAASAGKFLVTAIAVIAAFPAFSLEKRNARASFCGVESYNTRTDSSCGVASYKEKRSDACGPESYNVQASLSCPGSERGGLVVSADLRGRRTNASVFWRNGSAIHGGENPIVFVGNGFSVQNWGVANVSGSSGAFGRAKESSAWSCKMSWSTLSTQWGDHEGISGGLACTAKDIVKTCAKPEFGVAEWKSCRSADHGVESYATCSKPEFGVASYRSCSFYKNPEEVAAFIQATNETIQTNLIIYPNRKADLFSRANEEGAFACLIRKYLVDPMYEDVVKDLREKFLTVFGYEEVDAVVDCAQTTTDPTNVSFVIEDLDCDNLDRSALPALVKPEAVSDGQFARFKQNCTLKKSYEVLADWYVTKANEAALYQQDLGEKGYNALDGELQNLRQKLNE